MTTQEIYKSTGSFRKDAWGVPIEPKTYDDYIKFGYKTPCRECFNNQIYTPVDTCTNHATSAKNDFTDEQWCDILNGLNLLIEANDGRPGHYTDSTTYNRACELSKRIYSQRLVSPGNTVAECNICDGDHQYTTKPVPYDQGDYVMCESCEQSQEG